MAWCTDIWAIEKTGGLLKRRNAARVLSMVVKTNRHLKLLPQQRLFGLGHSHFRAARSQSYSAEESASD
jgi:hypothetical protein